MTQVVVDDKVEDTWTDVQGNPGSSGNSFSKSVVVEISVEFHGAEKIGIGIVIIEVIPFVQCSEMTVVHAVDFFGDWFLHELVDVQLLADTDD